MGIVGGGAPPGSPVAPLCRRHLTPFVVCGGYAPKVDEQTCSRRSDGSGSFVGDT